MTVQAPEHAGETLSTSAQTISGTGDCVITVDSGHERGSNGEPKAESCHDLDGASKSKNAGSQFMTASFLFTNKLIGSQSPFDDHPRGYPKLAAFVNSSQTYLMCRRFGFLHSRVLLHRQDELAELEKQLIALDEEDLELEPLALQSRRRDDQRIEQPSRKSVIDKIDTKLKDYDELVMRMRSMAAVPRPSERNYGSFYSWMDNVKPLCREEHKFVKHRDDFIALAEKEEGEWFYNVLEDILSIVPVTRSFLSPPSQRKLTDDEYVQFYSKSRVDYLVRTILTVITVILLMAPTAILFLVPERRAIRFMVVLVFTLLFSVVVTIFTKAKRHEMFGATAA
ncbi:MAG: hypothetical protein Q9207_002923 [Kuettlingeria erythrocarpa]